MVTFIGNYTSKLDDKGRLVFPAPLKGMMPDGSDMRFVIKKDIFADCLEMYTFEEWERQSAEVKSRLNFFNERYEAARISNDEFVAIAGRLPESR